jgi:hypothetical protein
MNGFVSLKDNEHHNTKLCSRWGMKKDLEEGFYKDRGSPDGCGRWCRGCCKEHRKEQRTNTAERSKGLVDVNSPKRTAYGRAYPARVNTDRRLVIRHGQAVADILNTPQYESVDIFKELGY